MPIRESTYSLCRDFADILTALNFDSTVHKCKNISIKMLKDVGMTVPKLEKQGQYNMQQNRG